MTLSAPIKFLRTSRADVMWPNLKSRIRLMIRSNMDWGEQEIRERSLLTEYVNVDFLESPPFNGNENHESIM